jgi:hypothetical protein
MEAQLTARPKSNRQQTWWEESYQVCISAEQEALIEVVGAALRRAIREGYRDPKARAWIRSADWAGLVIGCGVDPLCIKRAFEQRVPWVLDPWFPLREAP